MKDTWVPPKPAFRVGFDKPIISFSPFS